MTERELSPEAQTVIGSVILGTAWQAHGKSGRKCRAGEEQAPGEASTRADVKIQGKPCASLAVTMCKCTAGANKCWVRIWAQSQAGLCVSNQKLVVLLDHQVLYGIYPSQ